MKCLLALSVAGLGALLFMLAPTSGAYYPSDCCCNSTHNFFFGRRSPYDRLLYSNYTVVPARYYGKSSVYIILPPKPTYPRPIFTYVEVRDNFRDGLGACARIAGGGIGQNYIQILLTSSNNHSISSIVNAYGHY